MYFVLFKGGWYILILPVGTRFFDVLRIGSFDIRRLRDDTEEVSLNMPSRPTAALEEGACGLAKRVSRRLFAWCMFFAHHRQPTSGCRRVYRLSMGNLRRGWYWSCMTCMV